MGESAKHDMTELGALTVEGLVEDRVSVTVNLAPPRAIASMTSWWCSPSCSCSRTPLAAVTASIGSAPIVGA
ncbi:hypothetical protein JCM18918_1750 [Cutibacterium acnes JCM 18918]|nr:hypothetical protein JCM18918_1750 [Cutibacterium acnes JCM 18918]